MLLYTKLIKSIFNLTHNHKKGNVGYTYWLKGIAKHPRSKQVSPR